MSTQNTIAALLTAFGVIGLAFAPLQAPSHAQQTKIGQDSVALAISLGTQLRLSQESARHALKATPPKPGHNMLCRDVYHLQLADIGLRCHTVTSTKTVALVN